MDLIGKDPDSKLIASERRLEANRKQQQRQLGWVGCQLNVFEGGSRVRLEDWIRLDDIETLQNRPSEVTALHSTQQKSNRLPWLGSL